VHRSTFIYLAAFSLAVASCGGGGDEVSISGCDGEQIGLLVDGTEAASFHNDDRFTGADGAAIAVGPFDASAGEVIGYASGHAPTLFTPVAWSDGGDDVDETIDPRYRVRFRIWIVRGPFADQQTRAVNACVKTSQIWRDERQGTSFLAFTITDATGDPDAGDFFAYTCAQAADIQTDIGFQADAVNVYWVDTVDFGSGAATTNGVWCGGNVLAMGRNSSDHLFSHEIGHAFTLGHVNGIAAHFDTTNVMHNASNNREFLTEGQTLRAVYSTPSAINTIGTRSGEPTRDCTPLSTATNVADCPAVQKRIWGDGAPWPPN
jgi:hypothetical protein